MNRRRFLATTGFTLPGVMGGNQITKAATSKRVIVIGAGMSGIAAAKTLVANGHNVVVLEGRTRIGGRIATSSFWTDTPVDLGASWIHGPKGNPLTPIATACKAPTVTTLSNSQIVYDTAGKPLTSSSAKALETLRRNIGNAISKAQNSLRTDISLQSAIETGVGWSKKTPDDQARMRYLINSDYEQDYCGSSNSLSAMWFDDDSEFSGEDLLMVKGYKPLTDYLSQGLNIQLGQNVKRIRVVGGLVYVDTDTTTYVADKVVVTLPLGVLKSGSIIFQPGLPVAKQTAINKLGMGILNKCILRFPSVFWAQQYDWLGYIPALNGQWAEWISLSRQLNQPILVGFNAADFGRQIESWTDAQIINSAMTTLRLIYGSKIPNPVGYQITRWGSDPFTLGSYSFLQVGSTPKMRDDLAANINQTIFFAGEATNRLYPGTVHGAYLSGLKAAQDIQAAP